MKALADASVSGKRVILRLSLDLPRDDSNRIIDDERLRVSLSTIHYLINRNAKVIILGHMGRPGGKIDKKLSLRPVYIRLSALMKKPIHFAPNIFSADTKKAIANLPDGEILGLENARFDKGEENNSRTFARKLANYGDVYVNDAFSVAHREAASTVAITEFLPSYPGISFDKEMGTIRNILRTPDHPFVAIIGGVKIADKLPAIKNIGRVADKILVGGGVANTFMAAKGMNVRESVIDSKYIEEAKSIMKRFRDKIVLPVDFVWDNDKILDHGDETVRLFERYLKSARIVFWNGSLGHTENSKYRNASDSLAKFLADTPATTIVAGGNTTEIFSRLGLLNDINFISSGGGSALALLSGDKLPAVEALS